MDCSSRGYRVAAHHLLMTLPESMANIVDNLQSKSDLKYIDVRTRLLELASSSLIANPTKNKALNVKGKKGLGHQSTKPNPTRAGRTEAAKGNQCSWCKAEVNPLMATLSRLAKLSRNIMRLTPTPSPVNLFF